MPEVYTNRLLIGTQGHMISRKNPPISPVFYDVLCPNETGRVPICLLTTEGGSRGPDVVKDMIVNSTFQ